MSPEFREALIRGIFHAVLVGGMAFLTAWTDPAMPVRTLVSVSLLPALTVLGTRFIGEGWMDTHAANKVGTPEAASRAVKERQA